MMYVVHDDLGGDVCFCENKNEAIESLQNLAENYDDDMYLYVKLYEVGKQVEFIVKPKTVQIKEVTVKQKRRAVKRKM